MSRGQKRKLFNQPQAVINRWFAIKTIRIIRPYVESAARLFLRIKLVIQERKHSRALKSALETTIREFRKLDSSKFEELKIFFNLSLFFLMAEKDIQSVKIDALSHPDKWKRNLSLRVMLLTIHEWDMAKVAPANKLNEAYETADICQEIRDDMTKSLRKINKAHSKAKKLLAQTRNATIAHRDTDAMLQYELISTLDTMEIMKITASFYEGADLFIQTLPRLILEAGSFSSLMKQYSKHAQ